MKIEGLILAPIKNVIIWLRDALEHNSWGLESNLSIEVLKEYWEYVFIRL